MNVSVSRGKILGYELSISSFSVITNVSANERSCLVELCASCDVTVRARNSKGLSPPARVTTRRTEGKKTKTFDIWFSISFSIVCSATRASVLKHWYVFVCSYLVHQKHIWNMLFKDRSGLKLDQIRLQQNPPCSLSEWHWWSRYSAFRPQCPHLATEKAAHEQLEECNKESVILT